MKYLIYGCGGHSRSVCDVLLDSKPDAQLTFIDQNAKKGELLWGFPVVKDLLSVEGEGNKKSLCFVAIGSNEYREEVFSKIPPESLIQIISSCSYIGKNAEIGKGTFVGNFCHIGPESIIGKNTIINNGAVIEHEVVIGNHSHIAPSATISGRSHIGDFVFIGAGSTVIDKIKICSNVMIGAGSVVVKDIIEPGVYVGTPVRRIK